jgi:hypothetical protein
VETLGTLEMLRVLRVGKMAEEPFSVGEGFQVIYWGWMVLSMLKSIRTKPSILSMP